MRADRSWSIASGPGGLVYGAYDATRQWLNRRLVRVLLGSGFAGDLIVEVPSGPGSGTSQLARSPSVKLSVAVDIDIEALREGRRRDSALRSVVADVYALPFRVDSIDGLWSSSSVEHLDHPDHALAEMHRVLRPGGRVFVGVPYRFGPLGFQPCIARSAAGLWIGRVFGRRELRRIVTACGFDVLETMTYFFGMFVGVLAAKRIRQEHG